MSSKPTLQPSPPYLKATATGGIQIALTVIPNARKTELIGEHGDYLKMKVQAPPTEGRANEEIVAFFEKLLKSKTIAITRGQTSRKKTLEVRHLSVATALELILKEIEQP